MGRPTRRWRSMQAKRVQKCWPQCQRLSNLLRLLVITVKAAGSVLIGS
jgi:hypothetical protein